LVCRMSHAQLHRETAYEILILGKHSPYCH
jgi:hypothetical protein